MKIEDVETFTTSMPRRLYRKWLRALRSGDYTKATSFLVNGTGDGFCCLGVLANEQGCTWGFSHDSFDGPIPKGERQQKGNSFLSQHLSAGMSKTLQKRLAGFNDALQGTKHSHREIADWIESNVTPAAA